MKMKFKKYRIVTDSYNGYECQSWRIFFPFWIPMLGPPVGWIYKDDLNCPGQLNITNTFTRLEDAEKWISIRRNKIGKASLNPFKRELVKEC